MKNPRTTNELLLAASEALQHRDEGRLKELHDFVRDESAWLTSREDRQVLRRLLCTMQDAAAGIEED